jgi:hypothetical protein
MLSFLARFQVFTWRVRLLPKPASPQAGADGADDDAVDEDDEEAGVEEGNDS